MSHLDGFKPRCLFFVFGWFMLSPAATAGLIFSDDFQSDTPVLSDSTADADPVIGVGDTGGIWQNTESPALAIQVENDTVPGQNGQNGSLVAGANNYLRVYRGGGTTSRGAPYARNWDPASTQDTLLELSMQVYQPSGSSMSVFFGTTLPNTNVNSGVNAFATASAVQFSLGAQLPDDQWNSVRVIANLSSTDTQSGIAPQTYLTIINGVSIGTSSFAVPANQIPAILPALSDTNETFNYIDDVMIQTIPEPASMLQLALVVCACACLGRNGRQ